MVAAAAACSLVRTVRSWNREIKTKIPAEASRELKDRGAEASEPRGEK